MVEDTGLSEERRVLLKERVDLEKYGLNSVAGFIKKELWMGDPNDFDVHSVSLNTLNTTWHAMGNWLGNDKGEDQKTTEGIQRDFKRVTKFLQQKGVLGENAVEDQAKFLADLQGGELIPEELIKR